MQCVNAQWLLAMLWSVQRWLGFPASAQNWIFGTDKPQQLHRLPTPALLWRKEILLAQFPATSTVAPYARPLRLRRSTAMRSPFFRVPSRWRRR